MTITNETMFEEFPKLARLSRECVITEKLDGTNAQINIVQLPDDEVMPTHTKLTAVVGNLLLYAGSRTRLITPKDDNYGFAKWVRANAEELSQLGVGRHFGEWWGNGIQRGYGLPNGDKRFSLFNTVRWTKEVLPKCIDIVPTLYTGEFTTNACILAISQLKELGSYAVLGFMNPEGIVCYHTTAKVAFKKTIDKDE